MTSSFVREFPPMFTRRTYTRRPGSTTMVNATVRFSLSGSGIGLAVANA